MSIPLARRHLDPILNRITWIYDDLLFLLETVENFGFETAALTDLHRRPYRNTVDDLVDGPLRLVPEQAAGGNLQHVRLRPHDDAPLDPIAIANRLPLLARVLEVDQHVHALFLD